ncbi:hypothetical protein M422DRAFT_264081 [Sphaerobolus stellatus SS14]|uniref:Unplaced genomic scaffold SPHSTscaffold_131, whole genome shotgun sequence n=1 Tax=Sphaerobolus stellatus (strain SS14) TaxID=990650 RepID=A0A0C9UXF2_SPHS4|nr:hypothetical protein M422DRAFT_264081 [Sphaerobolus stellatus SS14]
MGKTSIALEIVQFAKNNQFWAPSVEATSTDLLQQILYSHLRITKDSKNPLDDIIAELDASDEPRLLLLDNFETPWTDQSSSNAVPDILRRLASLGHVTLMVTMRGSSFPLAGEGIAWEFWNLPPTDKEACRRIYTNINSSTEQCPHLDNLLETLGYMPFAVTLMARLARESQANAEELLEEWKQVGTQLISSAKNAEKSMNYSISLSVDSQLMKNEPDALPLLAILSLLPAGTTRENLKYWAPFLKSRHKAIATLFQAALVLSTGTNKDIVFFVLPVVQSFIQLHSSEVGHPDFKKDLAALAEEETNLQSILLDGYSVVTGIQGAGRLPNIMRKPTVKINDRLDALLVFSWFQVHKRPYLEVVQRALILARELEDGQYARQYFQEAQEVFKSLSCSRQEVECILEGVEIEGYTIEDYDPNDSVIVAEQPNYEAVRCISILEAAADTFATLGLHADLANSFIALGMAYSQLALFPKVLDNAKQVIDAVVKINNGDLVGWGRMLVAKAHVYLGTQDKAM